MSTYKHNFTVLNFNQASFNRPINKNLSDTKKLNIWFNNQIWSGEKLTTCENTAIKSSSKNETNMLIHSSSIDIREILDTISTTDFKSLGINVEFKSYEQASFNINTYFISFTII